ncbi:MAG: FAD-dependent oxidoreductase [Rhodospirillaceae bacterium]|nr:FAD-dependent oxidoreductase [Rhodospirillaceae bacterium]
MPVVVIGGGFYGCAIAAFLAEGGKSVVLVEAHDELMTRASYTNQARLHGGYHYPRSFSTAYRSRLNFARFMAEFRPAIDDDFTMLYAIGRGRSHVTARQFEIFCDNIEAPYRRARPAFAELFNPRLIEAVYETQEYAFSRAELRAILRARLDRAGVPLLLGRRVSAVESTDGRLVVHTVHGSPIVAEKIINCTYSGLNLIPGIGRSRHSLKHEITEMVLVEPPEAIRRIGVTVMDGPFFSFMPFPERGLYSFSHVRYTPHAAIDDSQDADVDPYQALERYPAATRFGSMRRDAERYVSAVGGFTYRESLFEVKTVMVRNESDDGRPIMFHVGSDPRIVSVMGAKIDNIYDALTAIGDLIIDSAN